MDYCSFCQCLTEINYITHTTLDWVGNAWDFPVCYNTDTVGDGICDDQTNNYQCNFDGGDCCIPR